MWVGPFWFGMLVYPEHELTRKAMQGPWFFLGPILMWWVVTLADPQGLIELTKDSTDPTTILDGLASLLGTPAGAAAAWAHMVAGDIFVTMAPIVFFGIMLMPVGVALYMVFIRSEQTKSTTTD